MKVVVIGAGVAGLAIGWRLAAAAGASVTVLDRAQPARGASWAAAGMLAAAAETGEAQTPEAELAYRARAAWPDFAREIEQASGMTVGYRKSGTLMAAITGDEAADQAKRANAEMSVLSRDEARALEPMLAEDIAGALWAPEEAQVDNRALGDALALAFRRAGGSLVANEAVIRIEVEAGRALALRSAFGRREADAFVLAAGAWSGPDRRPAPRGGAAGPAGEGRDARADAAPGRGAARPRGVGQRRLSGAARRRAPRRRHDGRGGLRQPR